MDSDSVFRALADTSRRELLDRLHTQYGQTLNELCVNVAMTRQAVSKHLAILEAANLVTAQRDGRHKRHYINPVLINAIAERWIAKFSATHLTALSALKSHLEGEEHDRRDP